MKPEIPERVRSAARWTYAAAYSLAYGFFPVLVWGISDWQLSAPLIVAMAALQLTFIYLRSRRTIEVPNPAQTEKILWPLCHTCLLVLYFLAYYYIAVPKKSEIKNEPNKAVEPTPVSVTIPAAQEVAPLTSVAHLWR